MKVFKAIDLSIFIFVLVAIVSSYVSAIFYYAEAGTLPIFGARADSVPNIVFGVATFFSFFSLIVSLIGLLIQVGKVPIFLFYRDYMRITYLQMILFSSTYVLFWADPLGVVHWVID